jgi:tRNA-Thr(GGU) m(6)t(6)A37 methyltransferase TsaA
MTISFILTMMWKNNSSSSSSSLNAAVAVTVVASAASLATAALCYSLHQRTSLQQSQEWERKRQEERTGRIRAEVKLRNALKKQQASNSNTTTDDPHAMNLSTIGTVVSPYTKRMGTPRQGALVPSSRGFIQFASSLSPESVDGIDEYSHIWVIFGFHANTSLATSKKTKVRPPRGGGIKVGQLATRSPHRPNDLGLSLVKMERWEPSTRRLYISALDLVDGTPVYDIKPYVHWDIPGDVVPSSLRLPSWVENKNDILPNVEFSESAETSLVQFVKQNRLKPLYASKDKTSLEAAKNTLEEILAQDPRSSHKGVSKNQRGSVSNESSYRLMFSGVEVEFVVEESGARVVDVHPAPVERQESSS